MHIGALKKWALALTFWIALHVGSLKAQILGPYGSSPTTFEIDSNGSLTSTGGTPDYQIGLGVSGTGVRMIWFPARAAFRAGYALNSDWDTSNIGFESAAFGYDTVASGSYSEAFGAHNTASGSSAAVFGYGSSATSGGAMALGTNVTASGYYSMAEGIDTNASGHGSVALGLLTTASAYGSTASGLCTTASSYLSFVIGGYNLGTNSSGGAANPSSWVSTDPLFEIGNGNGGTASNNYTPTTSDALVVYKNGNATFQGVVTVAPGGDIPMYSGD
jgi:hypothetical protein